MGTGHSLVSQTQKHKTPPSRGGGGPRTPRSNLQATHSQPRYLWHLQTRLLAHILAELIHCWWHNLLGLPQGSLALVTRPQQLLVINKVDCSSSYTSLDEEPAGIQEGRCCGGGVSRDMTVYQETRWEPREKGSFHLPL